MLRNVEIKGRIKDFNKSILTARNLCGTDAKVLIQEDTFFNSYAGRLKLRNFQDASDSQLIFYDRPNIESPKTSNYSVCTFKNPEEVLSVLKPALGVRGSVKKTRHLFLYGQTRIHIDQVQGLGNFFELEVVLTPEQTVEEGEKIAKNLMQEFGVSEEDLLKGAYIDYLLEKI